VPGRLVYSAIGSLDGYVEDVDGGFEWAAPDDEVHAFVNALERGAGTYLYGRGMYETMVAWETLESEDPLAQEFAAIWQAAEKIVFSRTLPEVSSARTRLERSFDFDAIRELKASAERDLTVGGAGLAAEAIRAGLVDEYHYFAHPVVVGGGKSWLPAGVRVDLSLVDERRFGGGVVYLRYRTR
jgi:dihydrofolate reductase